VRHNPLPDWTPVITESSELIQKCKRCARELPAGALVCESCHALVHSGTLDALATEAKRLEALGKSREAREQWLAAVPLLPAHSKQALWIEDHARSLDAQTEKPQPGMPESTENKWTQKLGPAGAIAILLAKGKGVLTAIFQLKFLLSFVAFFGFYWAAYGVTFGLGFAILILIHELGHYVDVKRRGLPADMPVFLPGFGAYVRWRALGVSRATRAAVSLAGPFAGFLASLVCAAVWWYTGNSLWAALARAGAWLNLLNLIPVWVLDGGQAAPALSKSQRVLLLVSALALWLILHENMFFLVALGAGYQAFFAGDFPPSADRRTLAYFVGVLAALGILLHLLSGQSFSQR